MRAPTETKSEQIVFRTWPTLRRILEAEAAAKDATVASVINTALKRQFAKKLNKPEPRP